jgi:curved DNA-binding protein CbpA
MQDYYSVLGVLPTAEAVVIRAAYKALAQRYYPDRFQGAPEEASQRMAGINEAYNVLSDADRRREYDLSREMTKSFYSDYAEPPKESEADLSAALNADWQLVCEYLPDLVEITSRLNKIAHRLAATFQAYLLETKDYNSRVEIASAMEKSFLEGYFGTDSKILEFARRLIETGQRQALRELNNAVRVFGSGVSPSIVIPKIAKDFVTDAETGKATFSPKDLEEARSHWHQLRMAIIESDAVRASSLLKSYPALVTTADSVGDSPLHLAVEENRVEISELLLQAKADPLLKNIYGHSSLAFAKANKRDKILALFLQYGVVETR